MKVSRYIAIVILVLIIIGVAYVRALFSHQDREAALKAQDEQVTAEVLLTDYLKREEVSRIIDSVRQFYLDSIGTASSDASKLVDSLIAANTDSLAVEITALNNKLAAAEKTLADLKQNQNKEFDKLVYDFYSSEVKALPADLSEYERGVSVKEIKSKVYHYFAVSSKKLEQIIEDHK